MISCQKCGEAALIHITEVLEPRSRVAEFHLCEKHAHEQLSDEPAAQTRRWTASRRAKELEGAICFDIVRLIISEIGEQQVVYLNEVDGERRFPIVVGLYEATSLDRKLKGIQSPRPLTHEAWASTIPALGGEVEDVFIHDLHGHIYFAKIRIRQAGRFVDVDVRPSDAFNMALLCDVPIYVTEEVANEVCS